MEQVERLTGRKIKILAGDRGYRGKKKLTVQKSSHLGRHGRLYLTQRAKTLPADHTQAVRRNVYFHPWLYFKCSNLSLFVHANFQRTVIINNLIHRFLF